MDENGPDRRRTDTEMYDEVHSKSFLHAGKCVAVTMATAFGINAILNTQFKSGIIRDLAPQRKTFLLAGAMIFTFSLSHEQEKTRCIRNNVMEKLYWDARDRAGLTDDTP